MLYWGFPIVDIIVNFCSQICMGLKCVWHFIGVWLHLYLFLIFLFMQLPVRPRVKRVTLRDLLFLLEQETETCRTPLLYKAFLKWWWLCLVFLAFLCQKVRSRDIKELSFPPISHTNRVDCIFVQMAWWLCHVQWSEHTLCAVNLFRIKRYNLLLPGKSSHICLLWRKNRFIRKSYFT